MDAIKNVLKRYFWRLGHWANGFLEGDGDWANMRFLIVVAGMFGFQAFTALIQFWQYDGAVTWLETSPLFNTRYPPEVLHIAGFILQSFRFFLVPLFGLVVGLFIGAHYIQDIYELDSYRLGLDYIMNCLFGIDYPYLRIEQGKKQVKPGEVNTLAKIGGPGYVMISPESVVLFESLRYPSSVKGAGIHFINRFETIKEIINLNDQQGYIEKLTPMTKDGIVVTVKDVHFRYRIYSGHRQVGAGGRSPIRPYPYSSQAVRNSVYTRKVRTTGLEEWNTQIEKAFDTEILTHIRTRRLDDVISPTLEDGSKGDARKEITKAYSSPAFRRQMKSLGVEVVWFNIGQLTYEDPAVENEHISTWGADWIGDANLIRSYGEAQRQSANELARSQAQAELLMAITSAMQDAGVSNEMQSESASRLFLLKAGQILESMSNVYDSTMDESEVIS